MRWANAATACGRPLVMLTVSCGSATSIAIVPRTYTATTATPVSSTPRRSVAAGSVISPPNVGASSSPANANVSVANRLIDGRSSLCGTRSAVRHGVALPCVANDHAANATNTAAGIHVP